MKHLSVIKFRLIALCDSRSTHVPSYMLGEGIISRTGASRLRFDGEDSNLRKAWFLCDKLPGRRRKVIHRKIDGLRRVSAKCRWLQPANTPRSYATLLTDRLNY